MCCIYVASNNLSLVGRMVQHTHFEENIAVFNQSSSYTYSAKMSVLTGVHSAFSMSNSSLLCNLNRFDIQIFSNMTALSEYQYKI